MRLNSDYREDRRTQKEAGTECTRYEGGFSPGSGPALVPIELLWIESLVVVAKFIAHEVVFWRRRERPIQKAPAETIDESLVSRRASGHPHLDSDGASLFPPLFVRNTHNAAPATICSSPAFVVASAFRIRQGTPLR